MKRKEKALKFINFLDTYINFNNKKINDSGYSEYDLSIYDQIDKKYYDLYKNKQQKEPEDIQKEKKPEVYNNDSNTDRTHIQSLTRKIIDLSTEISRCKKCDLYKQSFDKISGVGPINSDIIVLLPPITYQELQAKNLMTSQDKEYFKKWLNAIDIDINKLYFTSALKCNHGQIRIAIEHIESCRPYLDNQIDIIKPKLLIVLGDFALSMLNRKRMLVTDHCSKVMNYYETPYVPLYLPQNVMKEPSLKRDIWEGLKKIKKIVDK